MKCKVCSRTTRRLKILNCGHRYCRHCVNGVLKFCFDENGEFHCLLGCTEKTAVETTSSPAASLTDELKKITKENGDIKLESAPTDEHENYTFKELEDIIRDGDDKTFLSILTNNPNVLNVRDDDGNTLLMEAAFRNKPSIAKYLIDAGCDVNEVNELNQNAFTCSACYGHHDVLNLLINHDDTNINNGDSFGSTPLYLAAALSRVECVQLLLSLPHIEINERMFSYDTTIKSLLKEHRRK